MIIIKYFENDRVLHLYDEVNPSTISSISKDLISVLESDEKQSWTICNYERPPIKLVINSYGGSVDDMFGLIDVILTSKTPIYTYCTGYAMSAGAMIFLAGHKWKIPAVYGWSCSYKRASATAQRLHSGKDIYFKRCFTHRAARKQRYFLLRTGSKKIRNRQQNYYLRSMHFDFFI